jgi:hypothetical protein
VDWGWDVDGEYNADGIEWGGDVRGVGRGVFVDESGGWNADVERGEHVQRGYDGECWGVESWE